MHLATLSERLLDLDLWSKMCCTKIPLILFWYLVMTMMSEGPSGCDGISYERLGERLLPPEAKPNLI
jgi:hypothetical protein